MRRLLLAIGVGLAFLGAACGDSDDQPALQQPTADHNDADVAFAQGMIPHHEQAIEMSDLALTKAGTPQVKALADRIKAAQGPEINQMKAWLTQWGQPLTAGHDHGHGGHSGAGMLSEAEMSTLTNTSGPAFDKLFLEGMIRHHEGAVTMAQEEIEKGQFPEAKQLARNIVDSQRAEITEMRGLLQLVG